MKTISADRRRVLALDVRPQRAGYAAFEGPNLLLDVGLTLLKTRPDTKRHLTFLIEIYRPDVIVTRKPQHGSRRDHPKTRFTLGSAQCLAERSSITIVQLRESQLREYFGKFGAYTKHQIASFVAHKFPELAHRLPPPRRLWQSERARMSIFDAVSCAVTYFSATHMGDQIYD
jgi:hypothetical protein